MAVGYVKPFSSNTGTRQTGGQMIDGLRLTNRQIDYAISISRISVLTRNKKNSDRVLQTDNGSFINFQLIV